MAETRREETRGRNEEEVQREREGDQKLLKWEGRIKNVSKGGRGKWVETWVHEGRNKNETKRI